MKINLFRIGNLPEGLYALFPEVGNKPVHIEDEIIKNNGSILAEKKQMKMILHKAETRGHAYHGWLDSYHTFSFADYYNPERMHFGVLRVLNDDLIKGGTGFSTHPHENMEIISIPLEGALEHKDSMGNTAVISEGEIQVMSAGTGILHSEYNYHKDRDGRFLQIWVFPDKKNVTPRYDQMQLDKDRMKNNFLQILSPHSEDEGVWIHQQAWFLLGNLEKGISSEYTLKKPGNGVYVFVIEGDITVENQKLEKRDGLGIWDTSELSVRADSQAWVLLMEVPMQL